MIVESLRAQSCLVWLVYVSGDGPAGDENIAELLLMEQVEPERLMMTDVLLQQQLQANVMGAQGWQNPAEKRCCSSQLTAS